MPYGSSPWWRDEVRAALAGVLVARTAVNAGIRVVYPFLPEIARGLGVSLGAIALLVALRSVVGMGGPAVARLAERTGRRALMLAAALVAATGCLLIAGASSLAAAAAGFALSGAAKPLFDVPMQAWFGDRVPYGRRGRVLGVTELTWALSLLTTVPVAGVLIAATSWRAPFVLVAALAVAGAVAVGGLIHPDRPRMRARRRLRLTGQHRVMLGAVLSFSMASELLFVVYGAWLEGAFGLGVTAIGVFTFVVGASELAGEAGVAAVADRLGLRRSILAGLFVSAAAYASLGAVGTSLAVAVAVVVVWFVSFEVTIVASVPLVSELAAHSRDRLLGLMVATIAAGRALAAPFAPVVYAAGGVGATGLVSAGLALVAAALVHRVRSPLPTPGG
ncbi:MAG: MFS transporter [Actinobacteria bacterium]|nr:MFS transporter [Actinomycetota bacterium]